MTAPVVRATASDVRKPSPAPRLSRESCRATAFCSKILFCPRGSRLGGSRGVPVLVPVRASPVLVKKERKKTDNPREGWEDGTPPPHRDFKERGVVR